MATAAQWAQWKYRRINSANDISPTDEKTIELYPQGVVIGNELPALSNINTTQGESTKVLFKIQGNSLYFSLNYKDKDKDINISGEITNEKYSKYGQESVDLAICVYNKLGDNVIEATTKTNPPILFTFSIKELMDLNTLTSAELREPLDSNLSSLDDVNALVKKIFTLNNIDLNLNLFAQTDNYGLNLGEMGGIITSEKSYPKGYPKELVGKCTDAQKITNIGVQTLYSFKPKLNRVLKGKGDTLFSQTNNINSIYNSGLNDCKFYLAIIEYCTYRYMLAGLSNDGDFSCKWLYANNYCKFLRNLKKSEFSDLVVIFTEYPNKLVSIDFRNFNSYFVNCEHK